MLREVIFVNDDFMRSNGIFAAIIIVRKLNKPEMLACAKHIF